MRFDYLHEPSFASVDLVRALSVPQRLKTPLAALATVIFVVAAWALLERVWLAQARAEDLAASARFERSRADLERTRLERIDVERLILLDRRLRALRASGVVAANRLADVGNRIPERAWLTEIDSTGSGVTIDGRSIGLATLSTTIAGLLNSKSVGQSLRLLHAAKDDARAVPSAFVFELRAGGATP